MHAARVPSALGGLVGNAVAHAAHRLDEIDAHFLAQTSDEDLDAFIAKAACTHHHPSGTCRLGRDGDAVVDPDLRLIGLDNVFIVDASVIPAIPSGPINAAVVAIAETWSAACGAS